MGKWIEGGVKVSQLDYIDKPFSHSISDIALCNRADQSTVMMHYGILSFKEDTNQIICKGLQLCD